MSAARAWQPSVRAVGSMRHPPSLAEAGEARARLMARGEACGNCDQAPGADPTIIYVEHSGPLGDVQSAYLLCAECNRLLYRQGRPALPKFDRKSYECAQLLSVPHAGGAQ